MKSVIVFGGTGAIGRLVVEDLLDLNYEVKVFTRQISNAIGSERVTFIHGNVLDYASVEESISSEDIVIISLGFNNSTLDTMSKGTENILRTMNKKNCKRVVCVSAQGAGDSWDHMPDSFKEMVNGDEILRASFMDHSIQESLVKAQNVDWTIVRPTEVVDTPIQGKKYIVNDFNADLVFQISKVDVAHFIVSEIANPKYLKQVAMITC
jgi:putative NADH-flavin reductase